VHLLILPFFLIFGIVPFIYQFIWLSSLVLPEVRQKTKAKSYYYSMFRGVGYVPHHTPRNTSQNLLERIVNGLLYVSLDLPSPKHGY
jgi:hypothetical protein